MFWRSVEHRDDRWSKIGRSNASTYVATSKPHYACEGQGIVKHLFNHDLDLDAKRKRLPLVYFQNGEIGE